MFRVVACSLLLALTAVTGTGAPLLFRSGPFEVLSTRGEKEGREVLNFLEQLRNALGWQLGNADLQLTWPLRVLVVTDREHEYPLPHLGRDAYTMSVRTMTPEAISNVVKMMLDNWNGHLPKDLERGLIQVYSTLQVDGTRITLGTPPAQKDRDWTRAHMLSVDPGYSGKLRVLLGNLSRGVEPEVAYRNAFGMKPDQIENAVNAYIDAGSYQTILAPSRPLNPRRELVGKQVPQTAVPLAMADLMFAQKQPSAREAYAALSDLPEAREGIGLIDGSGKDAIGAQALLLAADRESTAEGKRALINKAALANKLWAEPWRQLAAVEIHPAQKLSALRKVAELEPRVASNWVALAELQEDTKQFDEAAKSWARAERASGDVNEREDLRQLRLAGEQRRNDAKIAARDAERRKTEEEMQALRNKALRDIRAAEAKANEGRPLVDTKDLDEYKEEPNTRKVSGALARVDCLGTTARLHIAHGRQVTRIFVPDPGQVSFAGGGQVSLTCGAQRSGRAVTVEYLPRNDQSRKTSGDAVSIEFTR